MAILFFWGIGYWILDMGYWVLGIGYWVYTWLRKKPSRGLVGIARFARNT